MILNASRKEFHTLLELVIRGSRESVIDKELNNKLNELHQLLVDYSLRLRDRERINEFFSYLEQWVRNIREEVEVRLSIKESISRKEVGYAKIIKEMGSLRG